MQIKKNCMNQTLHNHDILKNNITDESTKKIQKSTN